MESNIEGQANIMYTMKSTVWISSEEFHNKINKKVQDLSCEVCKNKSDDSKELFLCLQCGKICCSEDYKEHSNEQENKGHIIYYNINKNVFLSISDKEIISNYSDEIAKYNNDDKWVEELNKLTWNTNVSEDNIKKDDITIKDPMFTDKKYWAMISKLKKGSFTNIVFLTGAGISTSAGIPDFRSKEGIFAQLQAKYNLSTPEEFFDLQTFKKHPEYFYEFTKNFKSEDYQPTPFHYFMGFLCHKNFVRYVFTQNIDGWDFRCGIPKDQLIFAHGNFVEAHCPTCRIDIDLDLLRKFVEKDEILYCKKCKTPCKSKVVFYGEDLFPIFYEKMKEVKEADLVFTAGTSLLVGPFNSWPYLPNKDCWRVSINKTPIGVEVGKKGFKYNKENSRDLLLKGYTDYVVDNIIRDCGWKGEFEDFMKRFKK